MNLRRLRQSFRDAWAGLRFVYVHEQNVRLQTVLGVCAIALGFLFDISRSEFVVVLFLVMFVLILEFINSAVEQFSDLLKPRLSGHIKIVKDMMAAMVLIAALGSAIIGLMVFWPYFIELFVQK